MPFALMPILLAFLQAAPARAEVVAIVHGTVVPMDEERALPAHTVLVRDGRIAWVGPDASADVPEDATVIDAAGAWVLPGLADMHVHADSADFGAFLANGVTTIREMNGSLEHLEWRAAARGNRLLAPSLLVTGPLIAGEEQRWRHVLARTPEEGRALVDEEAGQGFDAVKIYDGLARETYDAIAAAADAAGIPLVGHVPRAVGLERALEAGQRSLEHAGQILHAVESADSLGSVAARIARAGAWVTPTVASEEALSRRGTPWYAERLARPEVCLVDPGLVGWWESLGDDAPDPAVEERRREYIEAVRALVGALRDAGVPILAGTDTPNPLMVPGFSLHEELAALVEAGLTPFEAIEAATSEAARFADAESEFGTIRAGARADLIVVGADPLADLAALRRPVGVMVRGEWLARDRLEALLVDVRPAAGGGCR